MLRAACLARPLADVTIGAAFCFWRVIFSENRYPLFGITRYQPPPPPPPPPPPEPPPPPLKPDELDEAGTALAKALLTLDTLEATELLKSEPDQFMPLLPQAGW